MTRVGVLVVVLVAVLITPSRGQDCAAEAKKATSVCAARLEDAEQHAKEPCGAGRSSSERDKFEELTALAAAQQKAVARSENALEKAKAQAGSIAKESGVVRNELLAGLSKQKAAKAVLANAKKVAKGENSRLSELRKAADTAMQDAVKIAGETDDVTKVAAAKDKAHELYRQMVDEKIETASVQHQVVESRQELAKVSAEVESQIIHAKASAMSEAEALKTVASERKSVASHLVKKAQYEVSEASTAHDSATESQKRVQSRVEDAGEDIETTKEAVASAKDVHEKAEQAQSVVAGTEVDVGPLDIDKLNEQAHQISLAGGTVQTMDDSNDYVDPDAQSDNNTNTTHNNTVLMESSEELHDPYAEEVQQLEQGRMRTKDAYRRATKHLYHLETDGASASEITTARSHMKHLTAQLRRIENAQHAAVKDAVAAVESRAQGAVDDIVPDV